MWKRKPKHKTIDERAVRNLIFKFPGVDYSKIITIDDPYGKWYPWGFVPNRKQPKPIVEILLERALEEQRKARQ